jgi:DNA helicase-2/ATP-dependent DNA helicase PcrA
VLYRTHAQSRALEAAFAQRGIPYQIVGGTRFYDRKEIRDLLAYLKLAANPADTVSLLRVINVPPRGVGRIALGRLLELAQRRQLAPGLLLTAFPELLAEIPGAGDARLRDFGRLLLAISPRPERDPAPEVLARLLERVPYLDYLKQGDPVQGAVRVENVAELVNATQAFYEIRLSEIAAQAAAEAAGDTTAAAGDASTAAGEAAAPMPVDAAISGEDAEIAAALGPRPGSLADFLAEVALVADIDAHDGQADAITLMTLHNAKGLEYDTIFLTGVEEQLLPHAMSAGQEDELEEERRLFYVGVTRAQSQLWILHALNRRHFGDTLPCAPSRFLAELPAEWIRWEGQELAAMAQQSARSWESRLDSPAAPARRWERGASAAGSWNARQAPRMAGGAFSGEFDQGASGDDFAGEFNQDVPVLRVGMRVRHPSLGTGRVHKLEGGGEDLKVIVMFDKVGARKLLVRVAGLEPL